VGENPARPPAPLPKTNSVCQIKSWLAHVDCSDVVPENSRGYTLSAAGAQISGTLYLASNGPRWPQGQPGSRPAARCASTAPALPAT
jgi:hypothetical protein